MQQVLPRAAFNGRYAVRPYRSLSGLGSQQEDLQAVGYGSQAAGAAVSGALAAGLIPASAVPIIGPAIAAAALIATLLIKNSGCGQTCIQTSAWANQAAAALQQNSDAYFALPVPRHRANQQLALQTFDQIWAKLVELCGDSQWGDAGKRCISDRQAGACVWHQNRSGGHPGEPQMGACWNWFNGYRDPIANDPNVTDAMPVDPAMQAASDVAGGAFAGLSNLTGGVSPLLLLGFGLVGFALLGEGKS